MTSEAYKHVNSIRAEKYWLDDNGDLTGKNPLAKDLKDSIDHLAEGLYTRNAHFIFELIQNAEDNMYNSAIEPSLTFRLVKNDPTKTQDSDGALIIENNETGFSKENIEAICAIGKSTKQSAQGFIGEKGIGFKSIFRVTSMPYLFSNGYQISLPENHETTELGYIVPEWIEVIPDRIDLSLTTFILPLNKPDSGYAAVKKMLTEMEPETILFLSKLKEIKIITDEEDGFTIIKDDEHAPEIQLLTNKNGSDDIYEYLLFKRCFSKPEEINHEKRRKVKRREVAISFSISEISNGTGKLFAYLPVRFDTGFPFIINADFILPSSREDIQDTPWNRNWLMPCVGELLSDSLPLLKKDTHLSVSFLNKLAISIQDLDEDDIYFPISDAVKDAFTFMELLPTDDSSFVSAEKAKLARGADLRRLLNQEQLSALFQNEDKIRWLSGEITQDRTPDLRSYLIDEVGVEEITPDGFARRLLSSFLEAQSDEWLRSFYTYVGGQRALWKTGSQYSWNFPGPLRSRPIIRLTDDTQVTPFKKDGSPNAYLSQSIFTESSLPTVKEVFSKHEESRQFLLNLGLRELDLVAEVIEKILPKYSDQKSNISEDEHYRDILAIEKANLTDSNEKKKRLQKHLSETQFIRSVDQSGEEIGYMKPGGLYFRSSELQLYFSGNDDVGFVNPHYQQSLYSLFEEVGVRNKVRVYRKQTNIYGHIDLKDYHSSHERGLDGFDPDIRIDGLYSALQSIDVWKSIFIWNSIVIPNSSSIRGVIESCPRQTYENSKKENVVSDFGKLLLETEWLPVSEKCFAKPSELALDDLPEPFIKNEAVAIKLGMKQDLIAKLAVESGLDSDDIEFVRNNLEEFARFKADIEAREIRPPFPERRAPNPERRRERMRDQSEEAPNKTYEKRQRSVRTSGDSIDPSTWLRNLYTNDEGQMVCQICKMEMPFLKRNGKYYFEKKEVLSRTYLPKENTAQYLALCPVCAAKYEEFVKTDDDVMIRLKEAILNADRNIDGIEIPIALGNHNASMRFVGIHFHDFKIILEDNE